MLASVAKRGKTGIKRIICLLLVLLLLAPLAGCDAPHPVPADSAAQPKPARPQPAQPKPAPGRRLYTPPAGLTVEQTVQAYFEQHYLAYTELEYIDYSALMDTGLLSIYNNVRWTEALIQRRRLLWEHDLCYVDTAAYPYSIEYIEPEDLADPRLSYWNTRKMVSNGEVLVHFVIRGEEGKAYSPLMAVGAQHTMRLLQIDGEWRIVFHYFPGSIRKFLRNRPLSVPSEQEMLAALHREFEQTDSGHPPDSPPAARPYHGVAAAEYAWLHTEQPNSAFYHVGEWLGNCANFTSQCIWYGFGDGEQMPALGERESMSAGWYGGEGGGSPAWENVEAFWQHATQSGEMGTQVLQGIAEAQQGDLLQTSSGAPYNPEEMPDEYEQDEEQPARYNHSLLVVDADTLLLAQNSPGCFVYYSDILFVETRILRPVYLPGDS